MVHLGSAEAMSKIDNLAGRRFGRLLVIDRNVGRSSRRPHWNCICDCGGQSVTSGKNLRRGIAKSCGCINREGVRRTHEMTGTPEYVSWMHMKARCENPKNKAYPRYGGRGIAVCERWQTFEHFFADMGRRPSPAHTLDRIENDGDYRPGNCRWATRKVQNRNRSSNRRVEFNGVSKTFSEWAEGGPVSQQLFRTRLLRYGWPFERALREPPNKKAPATVDGRGP